jgi:hypothetical protein
MAVVRLFVALVPIFFKILFHHFLFFLTHTLFFFVVFGFQFDVDNLIHNDTTPSISHLVTTNPSTITDSSNGHQGDQVSQQPDSDTANNAQQQQQQQPLHEATTDLNEENEELSTNSLPFVRTEEHQHQHHDGGGEAHQVLPANANEIGDAVTNEVTNSHGQVEQQQQQQQHDGSDPIPSKLVEFFAPFFAFEHWFFFNKMFTIIA